MGLPTLKIFCCCCRLETGGLIIGWFNAVASFILALGSVGMIFMRATGILVSSRNSDETFRALSYLIVGSIYLLYFLIYFVAAINLIMAVNRREHERMKLYMILMIIGVFLSFISLLTSIWSGLISALIWTGLTVYFFLCIYSLYKMLKSEKVGTQQPMPYG